MVIISASFEKSQLTKSRKKKKKNKSPVRSFFDSKSRDAL